MVFPKLNPKSSGTLKINDFSGGINLRDGLSEILDNQSTDCVNMYWRDGIMKTRPAKFFSYSIPFDDFKPTDAGRQLIDQKFENATTIFEGELYRLVSRHDSYFNRQTSGTPWNSEISHISFYWVGREKFYKLPYIISDTDTTFSNYFVVQHKKDLFCFCETNDGGVIYKLVDDGSVLKWNKLKEEDIYVPLIVTHCQANNSFVATNLNALLSDGGVMVDGYNLLSPYYKMVYSTVRRTNLEKNASGDEGNLMRYQLLFRNSGKFAGKKVTAEITNKDGRIFTHTVTLNDTPSANEEESPGDNLYMRVSAGCILFSDTKTGSAVFINKSEYVEDNMVITAPCENPQSNLKKVFGMTHSVWFGGDALGLSGGTRLFLCGNTDTSEKSLVIWSGLNQPLYFPENCYAYVGNSNQAATGFGRQNDTLVIFKERETYYTRYMQNTSITAEDLINQNAVDYSASSVYFPMIQLNSEIGCDLPDTVQLCRNRLVWTSSIGKVYTLISQNQYNEMNIYEISGMIENKLAKQNLVNSTACEWKGYYLLFAENSVYAMDYESYGYVYASSYNKNEDANIKIPWWYWDNIKADKVFSADGNVVICALQKVEAPYDMRQCFYLLDEEKTQDTDLNGVYQISSSFTSKLFDFAEPDRRKNIDCINISFGNNGGYPITVQTISDSGADEQTVYLESPENEKRLSGYITSRAIYPVIPQVCRAAVKIKCSGPLAVDKIIIKFRLTGGIR